MSLDATHTGPALPPWSLTAAGGDTEPVPARTQPPGDDEFGSDDGYMFGADGLTFTDFLDIINPLQHLPVVSTLYRALTGDEISPGARMVGGVIFGGPTGFAAAILNNAMVDHTGRDVGENVLAALLPEDGEPTPDPTVTLAAGEGGDASTADAPAPPTALTALSGAQRQDSAVLQAAVQSPVAAPGTPQPLIDRRPRPQPFAAGPAAPMTRPRAAPVPPAPNPVQVAALSKVTRKPVEAAAPETARTEKARPAPARGNAALVPTPLDPSLIPQAMLSALEKYEQMKRGS